MRRSSPVAAAPAAAPIQSWPSPALGEMGAARRAAPHDGLQVPQEARSVLQLAGRSSRTHEGVARAAAYDRAANDVCTTDGRSVALWGVRASGLRELHHAALRRPRDDVAALVALDAIGCYALASNGSSARLDVMRAPFDEAVAPAVECTVFKGGYLTCAVQHRAEHEVVCAGVVKMGEAGEATVVRVIALRRHDRGGTGAAVAAGEQWCVASKRLSFRLRRGQGRISALAVDEARGQIVGALGGGLVAWDLGTGHPIFHVDGGASTADCFARLSVASAPSGAQVVAGQAERGTHVALWCNALAENGAPPSRFECAKDAAIVAVALDGDVDVTDAYVVDAGGCVWVRSVAGEEAYAVASFNLFRLHRATPPLAEEMARTWAFVCRIGGNRALAVCTASAVTLLVEHTPPTSLRSLPLLTSVGTPSEAGSSSVSGGSSSSCDSAICALYPGLTVKLVSPNGTVRREAAVNVPRTRGELSAASKALRRRADTPLCMHASLAPSLVLAFGWTGARVTVASPTDRALRQTVTLAVPLSKSDVARVCVAPLDDLNGSASSARTRGVYVVAALLDDGTLVVWLCGQQIQVLVRQLKAHDAVPLSLIATQPRAGVPASLLSVGSDGEVKQWLVRANVVSATRASATLEMCAYFFAGGASSRRSLTCVASRGSELGCGFSDGKVELWSLPVQRKGAKGVGTTRTPDCGYEIHATPVVYIAAGQPDLPSNRGQLMSSAADGDVVLWSTGALGRELIPLRRFQFSEAPQRVMFLRLGRSALAVAMVGRRLIPMNQRLCFSGDPLQVQGADTGVALSKSRRSDEQRCPLFYASSRPLWAGATRIVETSEWAKRVLLPRPASRGSSPEPTAKTMFEASSTATYEPCELCGVGHAPGPCYDPVVVGYDPLKAKSAPQRDSLSMTVRTMASLTTDLAPIAPSPSEKTASPSSKCVVEADSSLLSSVPPPRSAAAVDDSFSENFALGDETVRVRTAPQTAPLLSNNIEAASTSSNFGAAQNIQQRLRAAAMGDYSAISANGPTVLLSPKAGSTSLARDMVRVFNPDKTSQSVGSTGMQTGLPLGFSDDRAGAAHLQRIRSNELEMQQRVALKKAIIAGEQRAPSKEHVKSSITDLKRRIKNMDARRESFEGVDPRREALKKKLTFLRRQEIAEHKPLDVVSIGKVEDGSELSLGRTGGAHERYSGPYQLFDANRELMLPAHMQWMIEAQRVDAELRKKAREEQLLHLERRRKGKKMKRAATPEAVRPEMAEIDASDDNDADQEESEAPDESDVDEFGRPVSAWSQRSDGTRAEESEGDLSRAASRESRARSRQSTRQSSAGGIFDDRPASAYEVKTWDKLGSNEQAIELKFAMLDTEVRKAANNTNEVGDGVTPSVVIDRSFFDLEHPPERFHAAGFCTWWCTNGDDIRRKMLVRVCADAIHSNWVTDAFVRSFDEFEEEDRIDRFHDLIYDMADACEDGPPPPDVEHLVPAQDVARLEIRARIQHVWRSMEVDLEDEHVDKVTAHEARVRLRQQFQTWWSSDGAKDTRVLYMERKLRVDLADLDAAELRAANMVAKRFRERKHWAAMGVEEVKRRKEAIAEAKRRRIERTMLRRGRVEEDRVLMAAEDASSELVRRGVVHRAFGGDLTVSAQATLLKPSSVVGANSGINNGDEAYFAVVEGQENENRRMAQEETYSRAYAIWYDKERADGIRWRDRERRANGWHDKLLEVRRVANERREDRYTHRGEKYGLTLEERAVQDEIDRIASETKAAETEAAEKQKAIDDAEASVRNQERLVTEAKAAWWREYEEEQRLEQEHAQIVVEDTLSRNVRVEELEAARIVAFETEAEWRVPFVPYFPDSDEEDEEWEAPIPGPGKLMATIASIPTLPQVTTPRRGASTSPTTRAPLVAQVGLSRRVRSMMKLPPIGARATSIISAAAKASAIRKKSQHSRRSAGELARREVERAAMRRPNGSGARSVKRSVQSREAAKARADERKMPFYHELFGIQGTPLRDEAGARQSGQVELVPPRAVSPRLGPGCSAPPLSIEFPMVDSPVVAEITMPRGLYSQSPTQATPYSPGGGPPTPSKPWTPARGDESPTPFSKQS